MSEHRVTCSQVAEFIASCEEYDFVTELPSVKTNHIGSLSQLSGSIARAAEHKEARHKPSQQEDLMWRVSCSDTPHPAPSSELPMLKWQPEEQLVRAEERDHLIL